MAQVYVDEETKVKLEKLAEEGHRGISDQIKFLIDSYIETTQSQKKNHKGD